MKITSLEQIFKEYDEFKTICHKNCQLVGTLGDLRKIGERLEIRCLISNQMVRTIEFVNDIVRIDAMDGTGFVDFPLDTKVWYEPWLMDRGSYLIWVESFQTFGKLATEYDRITKCS